MLEKITETLLVAEFNELNNRQDKTVKLFFLDYLKSLPHYYRYPIVIYMHTFNLLGLIFYLKFFSSLKTEKSLKFIKFLFKYFPGFKLFNKFYRTIFMLANYE